MAGSKKELGDYLASVIDSPEIEGLSHDEVLSILGKSVLMPDTVVYIPHYRSDKLVYHQGFDTILGYPPEMEMDVQFVFDLVHPDDQPFVHYLSELALDFHLDKADDALFSSIFLVNCRIRKFDGEYIMMLRRSTGFLNKGGESIASATFMHDIDFMGDVKHVRSRIIGPEQSVKEYHKRLDELNANQSKVGPLSRREGQILQLMAQGLRSVEIAKKLGRSVHTVNNHRKNMIRKTGLHNTADLVRFGLENGLI